MSFANNIHICISSSDKLFATLWYVTLRGLPQDSEQGALEKSGQILYSKYCKTMRKVFFFGI